MLVLVLSHTPRTADEPTLYVQRAIGKPAPMANARETGGPPPAIFETRRALVVPSGDPDPTAFGGINSATELQVFVSLRAGAADQTRFIDDRRAC